MDPVTLTGWDLTPETLAAVARDGIEVALAPEGLARMAASRAVVEQHLAENKPVYGLTTGLGSRVTHRLDHADHTAFSLRTVRGRSVGLGPPLPEEVVRAVMAVRLNGLLAGGAGASQGVADSLAALLNRQAHPVIPSIGSIGAADLCLMAHLGLALVGEGEIVVAGERLPAAEGLRRVGLDAITLQPKDGLAICNASAVSAGQAALAIADAEDLLVVAQSAAALSLEGFRANLSPSDPRVAQARPQPGQDWAAASLRALLDGGRLFEPGAARRLQDPISLRCVVPIHGCLRAVIDFARPAVMAELNGAADNPLVLVEEQEILSTGNFMTPLLALSMDSLSQAVAQVAALSLGRSAKLLIERLSGLPANLSPHGAGRSGFAPLLKAGESLMAQIRHAANPVPAEPRWAADSVEDEVTNAPLAARNAAETLWRARLMLTIELIIAAQAVDLAQPEAIGHGAKIARDAVRDLIVPLDDDRAFGVEVERLDRALLAGGSLARTMRDAVPTFAR